MCRVLKSYSIFLFFVIQFLINCGLSAGNVQVRFPSMPDNDYHKLVIKTANSSLQAELAAERAKERNGIATMIKNAGSCDRGHFFELVGVLHAKIALGQEIEGAGLSITLEHPTKIDINFCGEPYELHSAEFDVVTSDFLVECKCSLRPDKNVKIEQLIKEVIMIDWMRQIRDEWRDKNFRKRILFEHGKKKLFIQGMCTLGREVCLSSNWVDVWTSDFASLGEWFNLISILSQKKVIVFYENEISEQTMEALDEVGIEYEQNIDLSVDLIAMQRRPAFRELSEKLREDLEAYASSAETARPIMAANKNHWFSFLGKSIRHCTALAFSMLCLCV